MPLWLIIVLSAAVFWLFSLWFPLLPYAGHTPPFDIRAFAPTLAHGLLYALALIASYCLLILAYRRIAGEAGLSSQDRFLLIGRRRPLAGILFVSFLLGLPLLFTYPVNSTDIFRYVLHGRITSIYGGNPYADPPGAFPDDPLAALAGEWAGETTPYGPVWELSAAGLAALSRDNTAVGLLLVKGLGLALLLGTAALIWLSLDAPGVPPSRRAALTVLWAWNPALLLTFVADGHNDGLMIFWLALGWWLGARRGRAGLGFAVMILAPLSKPVGLLALPFFFLAFRRSQADSRARRRLALAALVSVPALILAAFLPWALNDGYRQTLMLLFTRLAREAGEVAGFSWPVWVWFAGQRLGQSWSAETITQIARFLFLLFLLWLLWRAWRGRSALRGAADVFFGYVIQALSFRIWYPAWVFPWLTLDAAGDPAPGDRLSSGYRLRVGLWFLLTSQLSVVIYGHIRVHLLGGDQAAAHLIGVPFVFVLPFLLARLPLEPRAETAPAIETAVVEA